MTVTLDDYLKTEEPREDTVTVGGGVALEDYLGESDRQSHDAVTAVTSRDPALVSRERAAANALGTTRIEAENHLDMMEQAIKKNQAREQLKDSPSLTGYLAGHMADAPVLQNDLKAMSSIEQRLRAFGVEADEESGELELTTEAPDVWKMAAQDVAENASKGFKSGSAMTDLGMMWDKARTGRAVVDEEFTRKSKALEADMEPMNTNESWIAEAAQVVGQMARSVVYSANDTAAASGAIIGAGMASGWLAPEATVLGLAMVTGGTMEAMKSTEAGLAYKEMIEAGADPKIAAEAAEAVGVVNATLEVIGLGVFGKAFKPLISKAIERNTVATAKALANPSMLAMVKETFVGFGKGVTAEVSTEVMQEIVNIAGEQYTKEFAGADFDDMTADALYERLMEISEKTFKAMAVLGSAGATVTMAGGTRRVYKAREAQAYFEHLNEVMSTSESRQTTPDVTAEAVQQMADDASVPTVYIDAAEFRQVMQENGVTPEQLEQTLPGIAETLDSRADNHEDIEIPMGEYAAKIAGTDMGNALTIHARTNPDALSAKEEMLVRQESTKMIKGLMDGSVTDEDIDQNLGRFEGVSTAHIAELESQYRALRDQVEAAKGDEKKALQAQAKELRKTILAEKKAVAEQYKVEYDKLKEKYAADLKAADTNGIKTEDDIKREAKYGAWVSVNFARRAGLDPSRVVDVAPKIVTATSAAQPTEQEGGAEFEQKQVTVVPAEEWRVLQRTLDNMTAEERQVFDEYLNLRDDADRIRGNLERLKDTPWAKQAIEAVFVRSAMRDLMAGREPRVQSMLDNPQMKGARNLLAKGEQGLWALMRKNGFVGNASKPAHNVNSSFLNCDPSNDCAKFCYATQGNYNYAASVVKSEVVSEAVALNPARAAEMTALNYKETLEYAQGKALRLFDKGDGDATWVPYIEELNKLGIRVQIFSKRPEFLRQVSDFNLRLLSVDESNKALADANPDLPVAFVYSMPEQIPQVIDLLKRKQLQVVLPVKQGRNLLDEKLVNDLIQADKTVAKHICPIDAGWKNIKTKKNPDGWNCTMCDKNAGVGCFHGAATKTVMDAAAKAEATINVMDVMSLSRLAREIEQTKKELDDAIRSMGEQSGSASRGADAERGPVRGSDGGARVADVSSRLDELLQALFSRINARAERDGSQRVSTAPDRLLRGEQGIHTQLGSADIDGRSQSRNTHGNTEQSAESEVSLYQKVASEDWRGFEDSLVTLHNISEPGLLKAVGLGGLPVPSLAVSKASSPLQQFGEITLVGTSDLADPAKNPVFSTDAYTARFPKLDWSKSLKKRAARELRHEIERAQEQVGENAGDTHITRYLDKRPDRDEAIENLIQSAVGAAMYLNSRGIKFTPIMRDDDPSRIDRWKTGAALLKEANRNQADFDSFIEQRVSDAFGEPRIVDGNRLLKVTLRSVVRVMTRGPIAGAEEDVSGDYAGVIRALASTRFKTMDELKANRGRVVDRDTAYESTQVADEKVEEFIEAVQPYLAYFGAFGAERAEAAADVLAECADNPTPARIRDALANEGFEGVDDETIQLGVDALKAAANVLTDYFEVKPQRAVSLSEFAGAVVPTTVSMEARNALEQAGLKIVTYNPGSSGSRVAATQSLTKMLAKERADILYQLAWHGSPYRFDSFSLDHIGTGEGAQAHGWGLYFALSRETAKGYRAKLTGYSHLSSPLEDFQASMSLDKIGAGVMSSVVEGDFSESISSVIWLLENARSKESSILDFGRWTVYCGSIEDAAAETGNSVDEIRNDPYFVSAEDFVEKLPTKDIRYYSELEEIYNELDAYTDVPEFLEWVDENKDGFHEETRKWIESVMLPDIAALDRGELPGRLFEVEIPDSDVMLDEQRPFAEQPEAVKEALSTIWQELSGSDGGIQSALSDDMTGRRIYRELKDALGSPQAASLKLNEFGVKGITYEGGIDGRCFVVFDDKAISILDMMQKELKEFHDSVERANMQTTGSYSITHNAIKLTPNANLSTFAHEMGHWYLEAIFSVYGENGVSQLLREDAETILKDFGLDSVEAWYALPMKYREVLHERFAFYVEQYLAEGKAPTRQTRGFFDRFAAWLKDVYKHFATPGEELDALYKERFGIDLPPMSEEVRRVLDRMVASEKSIEEAKTAAGLVQLFEQKPEGMSDEDWRELNTLRDEAEAEAAGKVFERRARDEKWYKNARSRKLRELQAQGKKIREEERSKIEQQVNLLPQIKLYNAIKNSDVRLWEHELREMGFSGTAINTLRRHGLLVTANRKNVKKYPASTVFTVRDMFSFIKKYETDRKFIADLLSACDREKFIDDLTTKRCLEKHSDFFDQKKMDAMVTEALHTEARSRMLSTELAYLADNKNARSRVYREAAKQAAEALVAKMPIGKVSVKKFLNAQARASRAAAEALKRGDRMGAVMAKRAELVQHEAALLAIDIEKKLAVLKKLKSRVFSADKKLAATHDLDYVAVARSIMTNEGIGVGSPSTGTPSKAIKVLKRLKSYDPDKYAVMEPLMEGHGYRGDIDFGTFTVEYAMQVIDDVQQVMKLARDSKTLLLEGRRLNREDVLAELSERFVKVNRAKVKGGKTRTMSYGEKFGLKLMSFKSMLTRVENWCIAMDGGVSGPFFNYIFLPVRNAVAKFRNTNMDMQDKLLAIVKPMQEKWNAVRDIEAPELGYTFATKQELIGAVAHCGNLSNKHKLLLGGRGKDRKWARLIERPDGTSYVDTSAWDAFFARCFAKGFLTKEDMDTIQAIWDLLEETKPLAQSAFKQMYGTYFEEVEATPVVTPVGTYGGGYVPAVTDLYLVPEKQRHDEAKRLIEQDFVSQMPVHKPGFSKSRVPNYTKPLALDIGLLCGHVQEVLKFAIIAPVAQEISKITSHDDFVTMIEEVNPTWINDMLKPWLKRSYEQTVSDGNSNWFSAKLNDLRGIAGMNIMAGHIANALQQWTGLSIAATKVSPKYLAKAMAELAKGESSIEMMTQMSPVMRARIDDRAQEFQSQVEHIARTGESVKQAKGVINKALAADAALDPARDWVARHAYFLQTCMQAPIDAIVWIGAYKQATDAGRTESEAIAEADSIVSRTQSSFQPEDVAGVEVGGALYRSVLVFYNYFGMQLNLLGESWEVNKHKKQYGKFALDAVLIAAVPSILSAAIAGMVTGFDAGDDDEWDAYDALRLLIAEPFKNVVAMIPFGGTAINYGGSKLAQQDVAWAQFVWGDDPYAGRLFGAPVVDMLDGGVSAIGEWMKAAEGDDYNARHTVRGTLDLLSIVTRMPVGALKKPLGYSAGVASGDIQPDSSVEAVQGFLAGRDVSK